ncbi:MAG TPA: cytochrome c [Acidiferrobacter sp.]|nr:cytochrome c [Acidiferrobacter sp.]
MTTIIFKRSTYRFVLGTVAIPMIITLGGCARMSVQSKNTASDVTRGRIRAPLCMSCHGARGISTKASYPNLAGQNEAYLINALHEYKDGTRKNPIMDAMAAPLSSKNITDLAAFFSSLPP